MKSPWIVLTSANDPYPKVFVLKNDIEYVSTITKDGRSQTVVTAEVRGRVRAYSVLETAKQIFFMGLI